MRAMQEESRAYGPVVSVILNRPLPWDAGSESGPRSQKRQDHLHEPISRIQTQSRLGLLSQLVSQLVRESERLAASIRTRRRLGYPTNGYPSFPHGIEPFRMTGEASNQRVSTLVTHAEGPGISRAERAAARAGVKDVS